MNPTNLRRRFLVRSGAIAAALASGASDSFGAAPAVDSAASPYERLLVLVELKGGNDGLNTVIPTADPAYPRLRPKLALKRDDLVPLSDHLAFHPSLAPLLPLWNARELAILQGVGYPEPNL